MRLKNGYRLRQLGDNFIVTSQTAELVDFRHMITLNSSAAFLWRKLAGMEFTVRDMAAMLQSEYDVEPDRALSDSAALAEKWLEAGLCEK